MKKASNSSNTEIALLSSNREGQFGITGNKNKTQDGNIYFDSKRSPKEESDDIYCDEIEMEKPYKSSSLRPLHDATNKINIGTRNASSKIDFDAKELPPPAHHNDRTPKKTANCDSNSGVRATTPSTTIESPLPLYGKKDADCRGDDSSDNASCRCEGNPFSSLRRLLSLLRAHDKQTLLWTALFVTTLLCIAAFEGHTFPNDNYDTVEVQLVLVTLCLSLCFCVIGLLLHTTKKKSFLIETGLLVSIFLCWIMNLPVSMDPNHAVVVAESSTSIITSSETIVQPAAAQNIIINANLFFCSWLGFFLTTALITETYIRNKAKRNESISVSLQPTISWFLLCFSSMIVMITNVQNLRSYKCVRNAESQIDNNSNIENEAEDPILFWIFDGSKENFVTPSPVPNNNVLGTDSFCSRTKFGIALGIVAELICLTVILCFFVYEYKTQAGIRNVHINNYAYDNGTNMSSHFITMMTHIIPYIASIVLTLFWFLGVALLTFGGIDAPGHVIGNLFFATWCGLFLSLYLMYFYFDSSSAVDFSPGRPFAKTKGTIFREDQDASDFNDIDEDLKFNQRSSLESLRHEILFQNGQGSDVKRNYNNDSDHESRYLPNHSGREDKENITPSQKVSGPPSPICRFNPLTGEIEKENFRINRAFSKNGDEIEQEQDETVSPLFLRFNTYQEKKQEQRRAEKEDIEKAIDVRNPKISMQSNTLASSKNFEHQSPKEDESIQFHQHSSFSDEYGNDHQDIDFTSPKFKISISDHEQHKKFQKQQKLFAHKSTSIGKEKTSFSFGYPSEYIRSSLGTENDCKAVRTTNTEGNSTCERGNEDKKKSNFIMLVPDDDRIDGEKLPEKKSCNRFSYTTTKALDVENEVNGIDDVVSTVIDPKYTPFGTPSPIPSYTNGLKNSCVSNIQVSKELHHTIPSPIGNVKSNSDTYSFLSKEKNGFNFESGRRDDCNDENEVNKPASSKSISYENASEFASTNSVIPFKVEAQNQLNSNDDEASSHAHNSASLYDISNDSETAFSQSTGSSDGSTTISSVTSGFSTSVDENGCRPCSSDLNR